MIESSKCSEIFLIVGVIFAGAVQDMVVLFFSMRRDGKSLGQMVREEIGLVGGVAALVAVFAIMIYSMIRHRKSIGHTPAKFSGPTGTVQWIWALVTTP